MNKEKTKEVEDLLIKDLIDTGCKEIIVNREIYKYFNSIIKYSDELYIHSINVAIISVIIGLNIYKDKKVLRELFTSALLHDYGKLLIPKDILNKASRLTLKERNVIKKHSELGYRYLKNGKCFNERILLGILDHHERMDGTGYSQGKSDKNISEYAKIIMIADVYDAMISDRIYRKRIERCHVYDYLLSNIGSHFDKLLVKLFVQKTVDLDLGYVIMELTKHYFGFRNQESRKISI